MLKVPHRDHAVLLHHNNDGLIGEIEPLAFEPVGSQRDDFSPVGVESNLMNDDPSLAMDR